MAKTYNCDICGRPLGKMERINYEFHRESIHVCAECSDYIEEIKLSGSKANANRYFREKLGREGSSPLGKAYVEHLIKRFPADDPDPSGEPAENEAPKAAPETDKDDFRNPVSTGIISGFAVVTLITGIILLLIGLFSTDNGHEALIYAGIGGIISSAFLFVIVNISADIHHLDHTVRALAKDNRDYQKQIAELLKAQQEKQNMPG